MEELIKILLKSQLDEPTRMDLRILLARLEERTRMAAQRQEQEWVRHCANAP